MKITPADILLIRELYTYQPGFARLTMTEIAKKMGVSVQSVSRCLKMTDEDLEAYKNRHKEAFNEKSKH